MSLNNVDDLLIKVQNNEPVLPVIGSKAPENEPIDTEVVKVDAPEAESEEKLTHLEQFRKDKEDYLAKIDGDNADNLQKTSEDSNKSAESNETDDYGNKVPKSKVYTEEEVQAMIRKRLKLHHEERQVPQQQPYQPPVQQQQPSEDFQHDQNSELPWEVQLDNHIEKAFEKIETKKQTRAWEAEQQRAQADFESKFTNGMAKYADFTDVVAGKPITNGIMMAARSMADPAAFIYAAAKQQPKELERIAAITDPYVLAAEVGRLEERMKKARNVSKAPPPPSKTRGDIADKGFTKVSLDDLIRQDAKRKLSRR